MKIRFEVTGSERKRLVQAVCRATGEKAKYLGMPSMAYEVGAFSIDKEGTLIIDDHTDADTLASLYAEISGAGFAFEKPEQPAAESAAEAEPETEGCGLVVKLPADSLGSLAWNNLSLLLSAKGSLIKKALAVDSLEVIEADDCFSFPWFENKSLTPDEVRTYTHFISALCEMARNQKRVTAKETDSDNDKYAFRCFLLRLGFIGTEYKQERKILLRNLTGSSAFKGVNE